MASRTRSGTRRRAGDRAGDDLPGGFEQYFADLAPLLAQPGPPDFAALAAVQARYALEMDFASMDELIERFGLRVP